MADLETLTHGLLTAAKKAGADAADAIAVEGRSVSIDVLGGKLEQAERAEGIDIGLRVMIGLRQACVSASDIRDETLQTMAERAVAMAREAPEDPTIGLADPDQLASDLDHGRLELADPDPEPAAETLQDSAARAEAAALGIEGVSQVQSASAHMGGQRIHLAASNGFSGGYARTSHALSCVAISGHGTAMERDYFGDMRVFAGDLMSPEEIGRIAGERAAAMAGPTRPPTGAFPVLFDERIASSLIGHLVIAINGQTVARGASWLRDAMGKAVLPRGIDLVEDPHRARVTSSKLFDAEGLPTRARKIVSDGVLQSWTLDLANARKLGLESTANAARGTSAPPSPNVTNLALTEGEASREDLMSQMGTGLLVTSLIGSSVNPTTGDYSRGASGFWIENGEIKGPVNECTIAGNLRDMLQRITPANDARAHLSRVVPSLLVEGLTIAGT